MTPEITSAAPPAPAQTPDPSMPAAGAPAGAPTTIDNEPMPPEVLDNIRGRMAGAESQFEQLDRQHRLSLKQVEDLKRELLADVFESMKEQGVDPADPESVRGFLETLEEQSPDLARLFEFFFNVLSPEDPMEAMPMGEEPIDPMAAQEAPMEQEDGGAAELADALEPGAEEAPVEEEPLETEGMPVGSFLGEQPPQP